ncbi:ubiquinone/menaquinone biosynthesis methyltransferase ubiE [Tothia fuscella]|uniref:2-methoxy-6-polyprenyl-1,4-benzoquinol methylase, mitochondrial n=1 Tax=Tothia fuscella TaxID=1048955 RepID=A0A9P4TU56_9PEZI|nr:ubiquinone/menaquinone biosynthesis methyltransferase ubiE [Tothia fuscella]
MNNSIPRIVRRANRIRRLRPEQIQQSYRCFSCSIRHAQQQTPRPDESPRTTHFGFETVAESLKQSKVAEVFSSVASSYDTMNDLMSLGIHRLWKDHFVSSINPGLNPLIHTPSPSSSSTSAPTDPLRILDIAGGTGDIAFRILDYTTTIHNDSTSHVTVADINPSMLSEGQKRASKSPYANTGRIDFIEANAEQLSTIPSNSIDIYTVAFGIRNFTSIPTALREAHRVLKPGGLFACLEFSKVQNPVFDAVYKRWSFGAIPLIGQVVAGDRDSYQYLVESIERFPKQEEFSRMIGEAGFLIPGGGGKEGEKGGWEDLSGGIAAIHKGIKPAGSGIAAVGGGSV